MIKSISIFSALALAAFALFVAGCGSDDDEATGSANSDTALAKSESGPPSKAEFTTKAEAVCKKSRDRRFREAVAYTRAHRKELNALAPIPAEERLITVVELPAILREAEELDALEAPKGDERMIEAIVTGIEAGVKEAKEDPYVNTSLEDPSKYAFADVGELIRSYGLVDCRNVG
jgi:hypothetical protein